MIAVRYSEQDLSRMRALFDALPDAYAKQATSAGMRAYARTVVKVAKATTAFRDRTGRLRKAIGVGKRPSRSKGKRIAGAGAVVWAGGEGARQAHLIERGTKRMRARPFLEPALESSRSAALAAGAKAMDRKIAVVANKLVSRYGTGRGAKQ